MGGLLEQGYGRQKKNANDVELLHLPHHDVRHPRKPGKVRIGFHCKANFGRPCLNNKVLSGPDLISSARVLLQFRSKKAAFMNDLEMFTWYNLQIIKQAS